MLITTIHGSKGLEFPVVVLANLGIPRKKVHEPIPDRANSLIHVRVKSDDDEFFTPGYSEHSDHEDLHNDAEDVRLLYVAATRARDHLIVTYDAHSPRDNRRVPPPIALDELAPHGHPLLAGWGRQARDFIRLLDHHDDAARTRERFGDRRIDFFDEGGIAPDAPWLRQVQARIRDLEIGRAHV